MGKGLIGNSLSYTMKQILSGKVSTDDIEKIYAGSCMDESSIPDVIKQYHFDWEMTAMNKAEEEICQKYGVKKIWEIKDKEKLLQAEREIADRTKELTPEVTAEAEALLHELWNSKKIIQTRYRVPEGKTIKVKRFPDHEVRYNGEIVSDEMEVKGQEEGRDVEVINLNGEYYFHHDPNIAYLGAGNSRLFNNEQELIVNQIYYGLSWQDEQRLNDRIFALQKMFPQYKDAIEKVARSLNFDSIRELQEEGFLKMFQEEIEKRGDHTAEEIGEGVGEVAQIDVRDALKTVTDTKETKKDDPVIE